MNPVEFLFVIAALTLSSLAMAEGGGDRTFARMETARSNSMESYQVVKAQSPQPSVAESTTKVMGHKSC
ncbi:co-regulatory protein PtrA N-terminal domain-containing protein [Pseudomonas gingeri]